MRRTVARMFSIGGLDVLKIGTNSTDLQRLCFNLGGLGALFGGAKPTKAPRGDETVYSWRIYQP